MQPQYARLRKAGRREADESALADDVGQSCGAGEQPEPGNLDQVEHLRRRRAVAVVQLGVDCLDVGLGTNLGQPLKDMELLRWGTEVINQIFSD